MQVVGNSNAVGKLYTTCKRVEVDIYCILPDFFSGAGWLTLFLIIPHDDRSYLTRTNIIYHHVEGLGIFYAGSINLGLRRKLPTPATALYAQGPSWYLLCPTRGYTLCLALIVVRLLRYLLFCFYFVSCRVF